MAEQKTEQKTYNTEWTRIDEAVTKFVKFLREAVSAGGPLADWHVIFSMGTVTRVEPSQFAHQFAGYDGKYIADYPTHRLASEDVLPDIISCNAVIWNSQKDLAGDIGNSLRVGYQMLTADGYPYPGGEGSDRIPIPAEIPGNDSTELLWHVMWMHRHKYINNLVISEDPMEAILTAGEFRRLDVMFPKVYAVISPDLVITRID